MQAAEASISETDGCDTRRFVTVTPGIVVSVREWEGESLVASLENRGSEHYSFYKVVYILGDGKSNQCFPLITWILLMLGCLLDSNSGCCWDTITAARLLLVHLTGWLWLRLIYRDLALGLMFTPGVCKT